MATRATQFDLAWATGWENETNTYMTPILKPPLLPVIRFPWISFPPARGKGPTHSRLTGNRQTAWVDDAHTGEARSWANPPTSPTLLVPPDLAVVLADYSALFPQD